VGAQANCPRPGGSRFVALDVVGLVSAVALGDIHGGVSCSDQLVRCYVPTVIIEFDDADADAADEALGKRCDGGAQPGGQRRGQTSVGEQGGDQEFLAAGAADRRTGRALLLQ
jgi:hypothetical protein